MNDIFLFSLSMMDGLYFVSLLTVAALPIFFLFYIFLLFATNFMLKIFLYLQNYTSSLDLIETQTSGCFQDTKANKQ